MRYWIGRGCLALRFTLLTRLLKLFCMYVFFSPGYVHSIFSDGPLQKHCSFLVEWATRTATLKAEGTTAAEKALHLKTYVAACGVVPRVKQGEDDAAAGFEAKVFAAAWAVKELFDRMNILQDAALFTALVKGELAGRDCMKHLPENLAAFATVLHTNWEKELETLQSEEADLVSFFPKLSLFETAVAFSAGNSELHIKEADLLADVKGKCSDFVKAYVSSFGKASAATSEYMVARFDTFLSKYESIEACAESWQMDPCKWMFADEFEDEVQRDVEAFKSSRTDFLELAEKICSAMQRFGSSQSDDLQAEFAKCKEFTERGKAKADKGASVTVLILFSHCALSDSVRDFDPVSTFVKKSFGEEFGRHKLPQKLAAQLNEKEKSQQDASNRKKEEKKSKKDKKKDKDKKETKESKEDEKPKASKRPSDGGSSKKEKRRKSK